MAKALAYPLAPNDTLNLRCPCDPQADASQSCQSNDALPLQLVLRHGALVFWFRGERREVESRGEERRGESREERREVERRGRGGR